MGIIQELLGQGMYIWFILIISAILVGFSKTGINGVTMLIIPLLVSVFGGKGSTGVLLPMLIIGDIYAVWSYRKNIVLRSVLKPLPWAILGIIVGAFVGNRVSEKAFIYLIGTLVIICLILLIYIKKKGNTLTVPNAIWFYIGIGIFSGFASMMGNAAGPIFTIYLLALGYQKNNFMGTNALFFFFVNLSKMPFQIFLWNNLTVLNICIAVLMIPFLTLGAYLGIKVVKKLNDKVFSYIIIFMTFVGAIRLFM